MSMYFLTVWICFGISVLMFWLLTIINGAWIKVFFGGGFFFGSVTVIIGSISRTQMIISINSFFTLPIPVLTLCHPTTPMPMHSFSTIGQSVKIVSVFYILYRLLFYSSDFPSNIYSSSVSFNSINLIF